MEIELNLVGVGKKGRASLWVAGRVRWTSIPS